MSTRSRRGVLGALATIPLATVPAAAAVVTAPTDADTELLRLYAEFHRQQAATRAVPRNDDVGHHAAMEARWNTAGIIRDTFPRTLDGFKAKAAVAIVLIEENHAAVSSDADMGFAHALPVELAEGNWSEGASI